MAAFFSFALSFPTVIYSFFLCVSVILWLLTIVGVLDLNTGDADLGDIGDADVGDLAHPGDLMVESHEGGASTAAEAMGLLSRMGLSGVPVTLLVTLLALFGWLISYFIQLLLLSHIPLIILYYPAGLVAFFVALAASIWITARVCKPLRKAFRNSHAASNRSFIGQTATVTSMSVSSTYGEATINNDGSAFILHIRADAANKFKRGDKVVLLEFVSGENAYRVISESEFQGL